MMTPNAGLAALEDHIQQDLARLRLPPEDWTVPRTGPDGTVMAEVLIVGAGMFGLAAAGSLLLKGIRNIRIVDRNPADREGPWRTFARMETLRSSKDLPGLAFGLPSLTFRAWYESSRGTEAWDALYKIPNADWQAYLGWLRHVLKLPVENDVSIAALRPEADHVRVEQADGRVFYAKRVVLATGRPGGGSSLPAGIAEDLWPDLVAHSSDSVDFSRLAGRHVAVIGAGSSAWDNAATAAEHGAHVSMFCRRDALPQINKGKASAHFGYFEGWGALEDRHRWRLARYMERNPAPPPHETVLRTLACETFHVRMGVGLVRAERSADHGVLLETDNGEKRRFDFLLLGTGFTVDLTREPMLSHVAGRLRRWQDAYSPPTGEESVSLGRMPYLGADFELQDRGGSASEGTDLQRLHVFNAAGFASFGTLTLDIPSVSAAGERIAAAITRRLFSEDFETIFKRLQDWQKEHELAPTPFYHPDAVQS